MANDEEVTWGVAIEKTRARWVHAYDLVLDRVPHPLNADYDVRRGLDWRTAVEAPRCQHCLEIVGQYRRQNGGGSFQLFST